MMAAAWLGALCLLQPPPTGGATGGAAGPAAPIDVAAEAKAARALIDTGRAGEAITRLSALSPSDPKLRHLLGIALYQADRYKEAAEMLERVRPQLADGSPEQREAEQALGLSLFLLGRFADAIPWLEKARAADPAGGELDFTLGQAYIQRQDAAGARAALGRAFAVVPDSASAHVVTAQLMIRLQMEMLAETELRAALEKDPRAPRANYLLGQLALFRGQLDEAVSRSSKELAVNPTDAMALTQMGDAYLRQSRWDAAIRTLQQSLWLNPWYSAPYILLGRAYLKKDQPALAESMLRRAIEYDPNNRSAHYLLAQLLQQTGRLDEAKQEFAIVERLQATGR